MKVLVIACFAIAFSQIGKAENAASDTLKITTGQLSSGTIEISDWQVYDGPRKDTFDPASAVWVKVPFVGPIDGLKTGVEGLVTYRRMIQLPVSGRWGIFIPETFGSSRIYINGRGFETPSRPADTPENDRMIRGNLLRFFDAGTEPFEITIEISNWHSPAGGGLAGMPLLGRDYQIRRHSNLIVGLDQFMLGALFIMGFYHFALHLLRPEGTMNLMFAIYCLSIGFRALFAGDGRYWFELFPDFDGIWAWKIELLCLYACSPPLQYFIRELFPRDYSQKLPHWYAGFSAIFFVLTLFGSLRFGWEILPIYQLSLLVIACYGIFIVIRSFLRKRDGAGIFLLSAVILFLTVFNDVLESSNIIESYKLITFGILSFIFSNSFLISRRFARAFKRVEETEKEIRVLNSSLEDKVEEQTRDIKSILTSIQQGIFTIVSPDGYKVGSDYSPFLRTIVGQDDLEGRNALDLLFSDTNISSDQRSRIQTVLDFSIGEMEWSWEGNQDNLVREFCKADGQGRSQYFEIDWTPVVHEGIIEKVLVTVRDVTSFKALEKDSQRKQLDLEYISEIVGVPVQKFEDIMNQANAAIEENRRLLQAEAVYNSESLKIMFINYHTLKGICRSFNLTTLASAIHEAEQSLAVLQKTKGEDWDQSRLLNELQTVEAIVQKYIQLSIEKLGRSISADTKVVLDRSLFEEHIERLRAIDLSHLSEEESDILQHTMSAFQSAFYYSSQDVFNEIFDPVSKLAKDLGKDDPVIEFRDQGLNLDRSQQKLFKNVFIHIIRNSLDHGIETAEERIMAGKPPAGKIMIELKQIDGHIAINYEDDGRGLNLGKLRDIGLKRGLLSESDVRDDEKVASLIFHSGLSTANRLSEISGRGVGMEAVRRFIEDSEGRIELRFCSPIDEQGYRRFAFLIHLPSRGHKAA